MSKPTNTPIPRPADDPVLRVLAPLVEAYLAFSREAERHLAGLGVTPAQFDVIATLGNTDGLKCSELSENTLITKGTLTGVIDRLEAKGLVERRDDPEDRRVHRIRLTADGDALFRRVFPAHMQWLRPYFQRAFTPAQARDVGAALERLRDSFEGSAAP